MAAASGTATSSGIFLPFWKLMGAIFVWYLFVEFLKSVGIVKSK